MIQRIVRLEFRPEYITEFSQLFSESKELIRAMPGCLYLELLEDLDNKSVRYTISHWESPEHLENYRNSELFKNIWTKTKTLFAAKPIVYSLVSEMVIS